MKYIYIKDKINHREIVVKHCPTEQMWSDNNTKPKQGAAFHEFRAQVMGIEPDYCDKVYSKQIHVWPPEGPVALYDMSPWQPMLPVPQTDRRASQECVREQMDCGEPTAIDTASDHGVVVVFDTYRDGTGAWECICPCGCLESQ